jgi:hypothetical protein
MISMIEMTLLEGDHLCAYCACRVACPGDLAKTLPTVTTGQKLMYCGEGVFDKEIAAKIVAEQQAKAEREEAALKARLDEIYPL